MRTGMLWILWLAATLVLSITPLLSFALGAGDDATASDSAAVGALGIALAGPLLVAAAFLGSPGRGRVRLGRAIRRGTVLVIYAAVVLALAWRAGEAATLQGDAAWAAYWLLSATIWLVLSRRLLLRAGPARTGMTST